MQIFNKIETTFSIKPKNNIRNICKNPFFYESLFLINRKSKTFD